MVAVAAVAATILLAVSGAFSGGKRKAGVTVSAVADEADGAESETEDAEDPEEKTETRTNTEKGSGSHSGNTYTFEGVVVPLPEDFVIDESSSVIIAKPETYPNPSDNINFTFSELPDTEGVSLSDLKSELDQYYAAILKGFNGIDTVKYITVDGSTAFYVYYSCDYGDSLGTFWFRQVLVPLGNDTGVVVTYTSVSGSCDDAFIRSIKNISFE